jgi:phosphonoacetaldehyde hydrolase
MTSTAHFPVKAIVFDWAGTMIDFGCMAPVEALMEVFTGEGVAITDAEARADMGKAKLDHLRAILAEPGVAARWRKAKGSVADEADIARIFAKLEPAMIETAARAATLIPGAAETFSALRDLGIRIGSGTGYTPAMMTAIRQAAAEQGYTPEVVICSGDTPSGRPAPLMTWAALIALDSWPANVCIKVDDAPVGIAEGKNAGCWTVGISGSGNEVGLDLEAYRALPEEERQVRLAGAEASLRAAGADFIIEDISQFLPVVHEIARRIAAP